MKYTKYTAYLLTLIIFTSCNVTDTPTETYPFRLYAFTIDNPTKATFTQGSFTLTLRNDINAHRQPAQVISFTFTDDSGHEITDATLDWKQPGDWPSNITVERITSHNGRTTITGYIDRPCYLIVDKYIVLQYDSDRYTKHGEQEIILRTSGISKVAREITLCN